MVVATLGLLITFSIVLLERSNEYKFVFLLPLAYVLILLIFSKIFIKPYYSYGPLFYAAQIFIFIRYVLTPFSMVISNNEFLPGPDPMSYEMNMSFILMIYELLCIYIAISIATYKNGRRKNLVGQPKYSLLGNKFIIGTITLIFLSILVNFPNSVIPSQVLFVNEDFSDISSPNGIIEIMSMLFKCMSFLLILSFININDNNRNRFINFIISFVLLVALMALFTGTSRWTMIFMGLAGLIVIERLYPKYKFFLRIGVISILVTSVISISMYKFWWALIETDTPIKDTILLMSTQFQAYFSGPRTVAQSLNIKDYFPAISISTFLNDFLGSVPFVSNFIDQSDRINVYFNTYNYRNSTSLIMPLAGIGYTYFGFILAPIFTMISQWIIIKLDNLTQREGRLEFLFVYMYLGLRLSMSMGLNTQSLFTSFILPTLPLLLIFILNRNVYLFKSVKSKNVHLIE